MHTSFLCCLTTVEDISHLLSCFDRGRACALEDSTCDI